MPIKLIPLITLRTELKGLLRDIENNKTETKLEYSLF